MWWEALQATQNHYKRNLEGLKRVSSGHKVEWEDPLVIVFGVDWRRTRDSCMSAQDWMLMFRLSFEKFARNGGCTTHRNKQKKLLQF